MKLKEGLLLREVAGQYVVVPTGKMVNEIPQVHYMSKDAAMLWNGVYGRDFTENDLINLLKSHFPHVTEEKAKLEANHFIEGAKVRLLLEGTEGGTNQIFYTYKKHDQYKLKEE